MTNPTQLSSAVQAVDRAVADRIQLLGETAPSRQIAAAALRAAADHLDYIDSLYEIATELENHD